MKGNHTRPTNILLMEEIMHHHGMYKNLVKTVMFFHIDFWTINGTILHRRTAGPWHVKDKDSPWRPYLLMQWIVSYFLRLECWVAKNHVGGGSNPDRWWPYLWIHCLLHEVPSLRGEKQWICWWELQIGLWYFWVRQSKTSPRPVLKCCPVRGYCTRVGHGVGIHLIFPSEVRYAFFLLERTQSQKHSNLVSPKCLLYWKSLKSIEESHEWVEWPSLGSANIQVITESLTYSSLPHPLSLFLRPFPIMCSLRGYWWKLLVLSSKWLPLPTDPLPAGASHYFDSCRRYIYIYMYTSI